MEVFIWGELGEKTKYLWAGALKNTWILTHREGPKPKPNKYQNMNASSGKKAN